MPSKHWRCFYCDKRFYLKRDRDWHEINGKFCSRWPEEKAKKIKARRIK